MSKQTQKKKDIVKPCLVAQVRQILHSWHRKRIPQDPFATEWHNQSPGLVLDEDSKTTVLLNLVNGRDLDSSMFQCQLSSPAPHEFTNIRYLLGQLRTLHKFRNQYYSTSNPFTLALNTSIHPGSLLDLLSFSGYFGILILGHIWTLDGTLLDVLSHLIPHL